MTLRPGITAEGAAEEVTRLDPDGNKKIESAYFDAHQADAIRRLVKKVILAYEASRWVPVGPDTMPEEGQSCFVIVEGKGIDGTVQLIQTIAIYDGGGKWRGFFWGTLSSISPKWWTPELPLPTPPGKGEA